MQVALKVVFLLAKLSAFKRKVGSLQPQGMNFMHSYFFPEVPPSDNSSTCCYKFIPNCYQETGCGELTTEINSKAIERIIQSGLYPGIFCCWCCSFSLKFGESSWKAQHLIIFMPSDFQKRAGLFAFNTYVIRGGGLLVCIIMHVFTDGLQEMFLFLFRLGLSLAFISNCSYLILSSKLRRSAGTP